MILVTGGTGLVGSHLLYHLTQEHNSIRATYRTEEKLEEVKKVFSFYVDEYKTLFKKINWVQADITDITSLNNVFSIKITHVYHCAALISFSPKAYHKMRKVNIEGTANVANFCIENKVEKLCYTSSIATLGHSINNTPISEENERNEFQNKSGYSITKFGAETEIWRASQEGVDVIIVNPGVILGSGFFKQGSGKVFTKVYKGLRFFTEGITGFVGVQDVVKAMITITKSNLKNERFILVSENKSFKEILFLIAKEFHKQPPRIKINPFITNFLWRINWLTSKIIGITPLLTKSTAKNIQNKTFYSSNKIKEALNYKFETMETVIKNVCKNFYS